MTTGRRADKAGRGDFSAGPNPSPPAPVR